MKQTKSINKVDARLSLLLGKTEKQLIKLKEADDRLFASLTKDLPTQIEKFRLEKNAKLKEKLRLDITERFNAIPNAVTHGLHFPQNDLKRYKSVTKFKKAFVSAFIKANATIADLKKAGVEVRNRSGDIFTCFIPLRKIAELAKMPGVVCIELARFNRNNLNSAIPYAQINTLQAAPNNLTGNGVVVGIVDTPLDFYHVDFRNNDSTGGDGFGSSRVLFLWDQVLTPNATESSPPVDPVLPGFSYSGGAAYGTEYSQANINAELNNFNPAAPNAYTIVRHLPDNGEHGSHVAGCAVGNGRSGSLGAAPGASIIHVRLGGVVDSQAAYIGADSTYLMDAFAYIFARASQLGMPCIANRSGSDNMGPHDGTTLGEQFLDNLLLTPDRVITLAAGNTNNRTETLLGTVSAGGSTNITINYNNATSNDEFEIWYDGHDRFDISLSIPTTPAATILNVTAGNTGSVTLANGVTVTIVSVINDPRNGDNRITLFIENVSFANNIQNGNWILTLSGTTVINGAFSSWLERNNRPTPTNPTMRTLVGATVNNMSIATPATGLRVIGVGSHNDVAAVPVIAPSSSCGPTRDGRVKPEITTVGVAVVSVNSRNRNLIGAGTPNLTVSMGGTSMASPIVAGTSALIYECRGAGLSWFHMKQILQNNVGTPPVGIPSNQFGFGFLRIGGGCTPLTNDVDVWLRDATDDTGIEPYTGSVSWQSPDIEVLDMLGVPVSNPTHNPTNFVNNIIRVTARNRSSSQVARNVEVYLYWADPGTAIAFPTDWKSDGIYTGTAPNFVNQSNKIVIPQIPTGGAVSVSFAWAPPAPGSNVRGDDHFCLLARLEHEADESNIGTGGWGVIKGSNNIALRNTHVVEAPSGDADSAFYITGTNDTDSLEITAVNINTPIVVKIPSEVLTWRDLALANKVGNEPCKQKELRKTLNATLRKDSIQTVTGIINADLLELKDGVAAITFTPAKGKMITIPYLQITHREKIAVRVNMKRLKQFTKAALHIGQLSGGVRQTGITIEPVKRLKKSKVKSVIFDGKRLIIK
ncbi:MAG TPA: S8 family serine peptidase [Haliscomenobacter sp.]|uniref:S8 family serine peptidase n=1 Tax=Haliscomenobacter sp. TaxID=2717303 RepID=UPI002C32C7CB|nr:S8 family serine peptidase [Haliscomenobacter sp.]HOY19598.1 S8 family serine peptidase [Haliscomenobacter sp.]